MLARHRHESVFFFFSRSRCCRSGTTLAIVTLGRSETVRATTVKRGFASVRLTALVVGAFGRSDSIWTAFVFGVFTGLVLGAAYDKQINY